MMYNNEKFFFFNIMYMVFTGILLCLNDLLAEQNF